MTSILDKLPELLKEKIPRAQDRKLLKELIAVYQKGGPRATKQVIADRIAEISEANP